jgi:pyruvate dehydrogenase E2 component (dihydrolipoamide acetyltransferase)
LLARLAPSQAVDFTEFGEVERIALSKVQKLTGAFLGRNWVTIPHVTHHDEIDIEDLEHARTRWAEREGRKLTLAPLLMRALVIALRQFPHFNASLSEDGEALILKRYFNIGVAVDTPKGLLVPVLRGVDSKPLAGLSDELAASAQKARDKGLSLAEMSGSSICLSSLGHIGGTGFTPIINAPDVAILGVTRTQERAIRGPDGAVVWRRMLPLSLSYDHRVINGADAARFVRALGDALASAAIWE